MRLVGATVRGYTSPRLLQLDTLRAFAILGVLISHYTPHPLLGDYLGALGVRLFFVLSGFLITGILLRQRQLLESGSSFGVVMRRFYLRRMLRIFPPYYGIIVITAVMAVDYWRETLLWNILYLSNVRIAIVGDWPGLFSHLWTLAVEEQFYLVWPWLILLVPRHRLLPLLVVLIATAPLFRATGKLLGMADIAIWVLPFSCVDSLGMGALLALCRDPSFHLQQGERWLNRLAVWAGLPTFGLLWSLDALTYMDLLRPIRVFGVVDLNLVLFEVAAALCGCWLVGKATSATPHRAQRLLEWRPLVYVGTISYGMYLVHTFVLTLPWAGARIENLAVIPKFGVATVITVALASVSWFTFERPILALKQHIP
jgi:peptidoglycan/LPS O-acetylase OafA/YrhL